MLVFPFLRNSIKRLSVHPGFISEIISRNASNLLNECNTLRICLETYLNNPIRTFFKIRGIMNCFKNSKKKVYEEVWRDSSNNSPEVAPSEILQNNFQIIFHTFFSRIRPGDKPVITFWKLYILRNHCSIFFFRSSVNSFSFFFFRYILYFLKIFI